MPLSDHVVVTVRRVRAAVSEAGFGTLLALVAHRLWEDRTLAVGSLRELQDLGSSATDTIERIAASYFAPLKAPETLLIGRRDVGDTVYAEVDDVQNLTLYDLTVGGLLHRVRSPATASAELICERLVRQAAGGYAITAVGAGLGGTFTIAGDHVDAFTAGQDFVVAGSTAVTSNDGTWTVASVALVGGNTVITVGAAQTVNADAAHTGRIDGYAIVGVVAGASGSFDVAGDVRDRFPVGLEFGVAGSQLNDNRTGAPTIMAGIPYTVASTSLVAGNTRIVIGTQQGAVIPGGLGTDGGGIVSWCNGATAVSTVLADVASWAIAAVVAGAGGTFAIAGDLTSLFPAGAQFRVTGSAVANNALWTVGSSVFTTPNTVITVVATQTVIADAGPTGAISLPLVELVSEDGGQFYTVHADDRLRLHYSITNAASADLTTVRNVTDNFYGVCLDTRLASEVENLAAAVEAITDAPKIVGTGTSDPNYVDTTLAADNPVTGSIIARLHGSDYLRSFAAYSEDDAGRDGTEHDVYQGFSEAEDPDDPFIEAAAFGKNLPNDPGSSTWNLQEFVSSTGAVVITADDLTATQRTNALAKAGNVYATITETANGFQSGTMASGDFIDSVIGLDWWRNDMETRIFNRLHSESNAGRKVPNTDAGYAIIAAEMRASTAAAIAAGVLAEDPAPEFTIPTRAGQSAANVAARLATGFAVSATEAGALHRIEMVLEVEV